jgi:pimeloyl-ACP methyl ester carboxylesterase
MATGPYYEVHGEGPTIIFAHGLGGNHASWFQQVLTWVFGKMFADRLVKALRWSDSLPPRFQSCS